MAPIITPIYEPENYQENRPTYKPTLAGAIVAFHKESNPNAQTEFAADVATGVGIFARELPKYFDKVVGTDISAEMLDKARSKSKASTIEYVQSPAESLSFLGDKTVDLITVATAAHWFDIPAFLAVARRVLKPTGTLAIFSYAGIARFSEYPQFDAIFRGYIIDSGLDENKLGPYWGTASRILLEGYLEYHKEMANIGWTGVQRSAYPRILDSAPSPLYPVNVPPEANVIEFNMNWHKFRLFLSSIGPLNGYNRDHPDEGRICDSAMNAIVLAAGVTNMDEELKLDWDQVLLMGHPPADSRRSSLSGEKSP
ncbi:trans-aconitate methyltransferase 1 [Coemansia sp. RSA 2399]|nr:trans-aconitate methyltransferase 1 [Coemansia sp. RSA 2399]KAJ1888355.1 trans-aconitate methyltransferase 1 [Coemansia sp. IMI 209127]